MADRLRNVAPAAALLAGVLLSVPIDEARHEMSPVSPKSAIEPLFRIAARHDHLLVAGHAPSSDHEARIRAAVAKAFPALEARFEFQPLGLVPDWWEDVTGKLVAALAQTASPSADLSPDALRIRAFVDAESAAAAQLHALADSLPPSLEMRIELAPSGGTSTARAYCERHFANFTHEAVNFEESGTVMRTSAIPVLDRVVALADACRDTLVSITGHSDSSGNEDTNRELSLARARAVAAHLESRGIAGERILVHGAGSSVPVADNTTRYGRSLNRRIVIRFSGSRPAR